MTVKIFVAQDSEGREWSPDYEHELLAITELLRSLWLAYHHLSNGYFIIANLRQPNADFVLFSERGIGVVDLKHHFGKISLTSDGNWFAGAKPIHGGSHKTPYHQVQYYGETLRQKLFPLILPKQVKKTPEDWEKIKFQLALCFTNPQADIVQVKKDVVNARILLRKPWQGGFDVINPSEIVAWALKMRFEYDLGKENSYEPLRLDPLTIHNAITYVLGGKEWKEMLVNMPPNQAYGHLIWTSQEGEQRYNLSKDDVIIGRSKDCDIVIPGNFKFASNHHCKITRDLNGVYIEDVGSINGTYLNNKRLKRQVPLQNGQTVILGGPLESDKSFCFRFFLGSNSSTDTSQSSSTEHASIIHS